MSHVPHELADEFPNAAEKIRELKLSNAHFAKIADAYHEVNREIHRIEAEIETTSDAYAEELKKKRLALKDEVADFLAS